MVDISHETSEETSARLAHVIRQARFKAYEGVWTFEDFPIADFPSRVSEKALALVRDDTVWSQLVPFKGEGDGFKVFRFHFPPGADNSGFVGWLASLIKLKFGSGVFVTCGSNPGDGGIFDYWGVPTSVGDKVINLVRAMTERE